MTMQPTLMTSATKPPAKLPKWTVEQRQADDSEHPVTLKVVDGGSRSVALHEKARDQRCADVLPSRWKPTPARPP